LDAFNFESRAQYRKTMPRAVIESIGWEISARSLPRYRRADLMERVWGTTMRKFSFPQSRRGGGSRRMALRPLAGLAAAALLAGAGSGPAWADDEASTLTGDWNGARTALREKHGVTVTLDYIGETLAVLSGGINRRASFEGRFELSIDTDLEKLTGLPQLAGASTHVTVFQIHHAGANAADNVGPIADPSNIDALPTTRLFTAWYQQEFAGGAVSFRIGQLAADDEFFTSDTAGGLINGTFRWGGILAANITNGGPAYPLATPGARLSIAASDNLTVLAGVFAGDPAGRNCVIDPQRCNFHGTTFSFAGGALFMSELHYAVNQGEGAMGLPGIYKLGMFYANGDYADQRLASNGVGGVVSQASPAAVAPLQHRGN